MATAHTGLPVQDISLFVFVSYEGVGNALEIAVDLVEILLVFCSFRVLILTRKLGIFCEISCLSLCVRRVGQEACLQVGHDRLYSYLYQLIIICLTFETLL
jgi:hypothetical protein